MAGAPFVDGSARIYRLVMGQQRIAQPTTCATAEWTSQRSEPAATQDTHRPAQYTTRAGARRCPKSGISSYSIEGRGTRPRQCFRMTPGAGVQVCGSSWKNRTHWNRDRLADVYLLAGAAASTPTR